MGYSENPELLQSKMYLFTELREGKATRWTCGSSRVATKNFVEQIHECLHIASVNPQRFPELARAKQAFRIHVIRPGLVEARPRTSASVVVTSSESFAPVVPTVGVKSAQEIINAWRDHMPSQDPIMFQQHKLDMLELTTLYDWCDSHEPRLMMLVGDAHLTLSLRVVFRGDDLSWKPPAPTPAPEREYNI